LSFRRQRASILVSHARHTNTLFSECHLYYAPIKYVFKVQSPERGMTGVRESVVFATLTSAGRSPFDPKTCQLTGWLDDPYDSNEAGPMTRNISERPEYDSQFHDHPLSRARWVLDHLQRTVTIDDAVKQQAKFSPAQ
jgi:hypothetical protein